MDKNRAGSSKCLISDPSSKKSSQGGMSFIKMADIYYVLVLFALFLDFL